MLDLDLNFSDEIVFFDTVLVIDALVAKISSIYLFLSFLLLNLTAESLSSRGRASSSFVRGSLRADRGFRYFRRTLCARIAE